MFIARIGWHCDFLWVHKPNPASFLSLFCVETATIKLWKGSRLLVGFCAWAVRKQTRTTTATMISMNQYSSDSFSHSAPQQQHQHQHQQQALALYNGVNLNYPGVRMVHNTPPIFVVDQFLSPQECNFLIHAASDAFTPAPVVGKGTGQISASRTSSTCYLAREDVPDLMRKVSALAGKPMEHCELPQVGRYLTSQQYVQVRMN